MSQKVLFVPGILNPKFYQFFWKRECEKKGYEFLEFDSTFYGYWNFKKMKKLIKEGRKIVRENDKLIVVCHSFGGILVNLILRGLGKNIERLVVIDSPLTMNVFGMKRIKSILGYNGGLKYDFEVVSFGSYFDEIVPFFWTRYGKERHYNLFADHMSVLFFPWTVRKTMRLSGI